MYCLFLQVSVMLNVRRLVWLNNRGLKIQDFSDIWFHILASLPTHLIFKEINKDFQHWMIYIKMSYLQVKQITLRMAMQRCMLYLFIYLFIFNNILGAEKAALKQCAVSSLCAHVCSVPCRVNWSGSWRPLLSPNCTTSSSGVAPWRSWPGLSR